MKKFLVMALFLVPSLAYGFGGYVGGGLGLADVSLKSAGDEDIYKPSASVSARVGMIFGDLVGLGLNINSWSASDKDSLGNDYSLSIIPIFLEVNFHIMGHTGLYFGVNAGSILETETVEILGVDTTISESETGYGAQVGWNFGLDRDNRHTLGAEGRYIAVNGDPDAYGFLSAMAMYNFWW